MSYTRWTEERDEQLRELRERGFSAAQIAVKLGGVTRSAVIGRADRMGLRSTKRAAQPRPKVIRQLRVRKTPFVMPAVRPPMPAVRPPMPAPAINQHSDAPVVLFDLEPHHCRWPVNDAPYMFCGDTKRDGSSYCQRHFGVAHNRVAKP